MRRFSTARSWAPTRTGYGGSPHPETDRPKPTSITALSFAVAPFGGRLVYETQRLNSDIWRARLSSPGVLDGEPERFLASTFSDGASWYSPDGERIAFKSNRSGRDQIWVADSDGSHPAQVTRLEGGQSGTPRFSPDGRSLLFNSRRAGNQEVYVLDSIPGKRRRLTHHPAKDYLTSWSADGHWIYFTSDRTGREELWKMPAGGGKAVQFTRNSASGGFESHDGEHFYFTRDDKLWRMPVAGGDERLVFEGVTPFRIAIVRDGVYYSGPGDHTSIHYFDFATGRKTKVLEVDTTIANGLSVSPDGQWLLFPRREPIASDLMLVEGIR